MNTIDDATPEQIANMLTAPIVKLYKRCARGKHDQCPGMFETWSVCSCDCHAGVSDMRAAATMPVEPSQMPVTCADKAEAVSEAIAIVKRTVKAKAKVSGLSTKTDKYAKWANAIVAKNARLEAAWDVVRETKGMKRAVIAPAVRVTRCASGHMIKAEYNDDYSKVIVSDGCNASGCEHANAETKKWDRKLARKGKE